MTAAAHVYEIFIRAPQQRVWDALDRSRVHHAGTSTARASSRRSSPARRSSTASSMPDRLAADGTIEVFEPPSRLVYTWHVLYDAEMAEEPPGRVEWTLTPANDDGSVTRVTLRHGDLAMSPKTWENVRIGWVGDHRQPEDAARDRRADARRRQRRARSAGAEVEAEWHRMPGDGRQQQHVGAARRAPR